MTTVRNLLLLLCVCTAATTVAQEMEQRLDEIVVTGLTGTTSIHKTSTPMAVVSQQTLHHSSYTNLIDALAHQPGLSQVTTGSGISKPVIRGLGYNRIVVIHDGIKQEGQQWGDEHGIEIDAQSITSVEILKGPASLMYGSDALAGVLIFHGAHTLPDKSVEAILTTDYQTNNGLLNYSLDASGRQGQMVWDFRYSDKWAHAYKNRYDGYVPNSGFRERAASGMLGLNGAAGYSHLKLGLYHIVPGIVEGERDEETGELETGDDGAKSYRLDCPFQKVYHYRAVLDNSLDIAGGALKLLVGYQQNRRQEFEESPDDYELYLMLHTLNYDARWLSRSMRGVKVAVGVNGMYQTSLNKGEEFLIPDYNLVDCGVYATASKQWRRVTVSGGLRYDHRSLHSKALEEDDETRFSDFSRHFSGVTGSAGLAYNPSRSLILRANLSRGFRAPNISELASNGVHEGTLRYELGNQSLRPEQSWQFDAGADYAARGWTASASLIANYIDNNIFYERIVDASGNSVTLDDCPAYQFVAGDARLMGGEVMVDVTLAEGLHWENAFSYVHAVQLHQTADARYLPLTPAPRWNTTLHYALPTRCQGLSNLCCSLGTETNFRQSHYYGINGTETATPSYTLLNAAVSLDITAKHRKVANISLTANNLLDCAYQSHLSRLKYTDTNSVTGRRGVFNMGRNFGIKLLIPLASGEKKRLFQ